MPTLDDNLMYKTQGLREKVIYPTASDLTSEDKKLIGAQYQIKVKGFPEGTTDHFMHILRDVKKTPMDDEGRLSSFISVECGPTVTGPLYGPNYAKKRPIDMLFLTRYQGPIRPDALGPKFSTVPEISESY